MNLITFFNEVKSRGGVKVLSSGFLAKFITIFVTVIATRFIDKESFGAISFALMFVTPLIPLASAGLDFSYIYKASSLGSVATGKFFYNLFIIGVLISILCFVLISLIAFNYFETESEKRNVFIIVSCLFVTDFVLRMMQNNLRVREKNTLFAKSMSLRPAFLISTCVISIPVFGVYGYAVSLILAPFFTSLYLFLTHPPIYCPGKLDSRELLLSIKYGLNTGIGAVFSQSIFPMAGLMIGVLLASDELVADYRIASIIPLSLLLIPQLFFKSEFVHLARNDKNKKEIKAYIYNYLKIMVLLSLVMLVATYIFGELIFVIIFGENYRTAFESFFILLFGVIGAFLFRQLFGNLNFASGRADVNVWSSFISTLFCIVLSIKLLEILPATGAAYGVTATMWFSGVLNGFTYWYFIYRKL